MARGGGRARAAAALVVAVAAAASVACGRSADSPSAADRAAQRRLAALERQWAATPAEVRRLLNAPCRAGTDLLSVPGAVVGCGSDPGEPWSPGDGLDTVRLVDPVAISLSPARPAPDAECTSAPSTTGARRVGAQCWFVQAPAVQTRTTGVVYSEGGRPLLTAELAPGSLAGSDATSYLATVDGAACGVVGSDPPPSATAGLVVVCPLPRP